MVKPFAVDSHDLGHGDKGLIICMFDESENLLALATTSHDDEYTAFVF